MEKIIFLCNISIEEATELSRFQLKYLKRTVIRMKFQFLMLTTEFHGVRVFLRNPFLFYLWLKQIILSAFRGIMSRTVCNAITCNKFSATQFFVRTYTVHFV